MSYEKPGDFGGGGALEVPGEATASPNQAKVRSTTQRCGKSWKPLTPGGRWTMSIVHGPQWASASDELLAAINPVGKDCRSLGKRSSHALQQGDRSMDRPGRWQDEHGRPVADRWYR